MTRLVLLAACTLALAGCFSSSGGGGSAPSRTYLIEPNGQAVPVQPGSHIEGGTTP